MSAFALAPDLAPVDGLVPEARRAQTKNPYTPVMIAVSIAATIGILAYGWFLLNPSNRGDLLPWAMVIVAEVILIFHALMAMWTILAGSEGPAHLRVPRRAARPVRPRPPTSGWRHRRPHPVAAAPGRGAGHRRRADHRVRRAAGRHPAHRRGRDGRPRGAHDLDPRRRQVRRGARPGGRAADAATSAGSPTTAPRPATSTTR